MLTLCRFEISGITGSPVEDKIPSGATCWFVCPSTQPDAESRCRDVLAPMGYQIEELQAQEPLTEDGLLALDKRLFDNYLLLGYALRFFVPSAS